VGAGPIRTPDRRLRVFISSTLGELADERRAARAAVEQLRLTPVMFEAGARPHPPRALYRSYLEQSDVFVAIYWQRYGWVAPDMDVSGLEDELLLSDGMPRLVYVKRPAPDKDPGLAAMLERLQRDDSVSYKPFRDADELRDLLLDDLALLLTERFDGSRELPAVDAQPAHNLPAQTSTFLGREAELRDLRDLLAGEQVRLVTLTGPGGTGKTRLAIQAAAEQVERFVDGVFFVDLSPEREAEQAFTAVARTLGVLVAGEDGPLDALEAELRTRRVLLVLDNVEQVTSAAVGIVQLLERCSAVKVLVTSREALRVRGERVFPVLPLSLPDAGDSADSAEAVQLFCERAAAAQPDFQLTPDNAADVVAICQALDGLPLAIELAAARIRLFDAAELRARLANRSDALRSGARDLPKRQQTLHDAISWSYDLLSDDERLVLLLFAVFSGARLPDVEETAQQVPQTQSLDVIEALGSLVDKSLVRSERGSDGRPRFSLLRTIRSYVLARLDEVPELAVAARRAHAEHYTEGAAARHRRLTFAARQEVIAALADELDNLRAAWDEWVARADVARLNELLGPLWGYYDARGDYRSAAELGNDLLARLGETPDSPERRRDEFVVRMNVVRTELAMRGFTPEAERIVYAALERPDATGDARARFPGLRTLAYLHLMRYDFAQTGVLAQELMGIAEAEQDPLLLAEAHLLVGLTIGWSDVRLSLEHLDRAVVFFESTPSGYVDFRVGPNPWVVAIVVSSLTRWLAGSPDAAAAAMQRALDLAAGLDHPYSMAYALHHAGLLDVWRRDLEAVTARADALLAIAQAHGYPTWRALALVLGGLAAVGSGDADAGMARVEEGFELYQGLSTPPVFWPALLMLRAVALGQAGRTDEALSVIGQAEAVLQPGDPLAPDVGLVHGDLLLSLPAPDVTEAVAVFERVVKVTAEQQARLPQLQALTRLATLRRGTPDEAAAQDALRELYDGFTEGFDTAPLVAARAALAALDGPAA
jgi:predicted ATPase